MSSHGCGFDYASPLNAYQGVKCPGVVDTFRIPKLGAAFYLSQVVPENRIVLEPSFYWDEKLHVSSGTGAIFSNCEELHVFLNDTLFRVLQPDRKNYPRLRYPPFLVDLTWNAMDRMVLRIDGYLTGKQSISRSFQSSHAQDQIWIKADDDRIAADGVDSTRISFGMADRFGNQRPAADGILRVQHAGVGRLLGDRTLAMNEGAAGAVWFRSIPNRSGRGTIDVTHSTLGKQSVVIHVD